MTTPPTARPPAREHAPWTIWLAAVCIWFRAGLGLFLATGLFILGIDVRNGDEAGSPGLLTAGSFAFLLASIAWIVVSMLLLRRRRWARRTTVVFEAITVLFGGIVTVYSDGASLIGPFCLVFGALALIVVLMGPSAAWCSK
jgi:hypothetical protein